MNFSFFKPTGILAQYIRHYWVLEADVNERPVTELIIPTGNIEMMFHFRKPFLNKNDRNSLTHPKSFISGISSSQSEVTTQGESGLIAVTFFPHGASHFLPFPLQEIEDKNIDLKDVFNKDTRQLEEQLTNTATVEKRIALVELFLLKRFRPLREYDLKLIHGSVGLIAVNKGNINPGALSEKLLLSPKNLERKFSSLLGKTPKQYIRIIRFQHILKSFSIPGKSLTQIAYEHGYFDQAHFIKDFKSLSGFTPREFLSRFANCSSDYFD